MEILELQLKEKIQIVYFILFKKMKLISLIKWFLTKCGAMVKFKEKNSQKKILEKKKNNTDDIYPLW